MRVHIYARVSTDAQAEKGYSLATQLEACRAKAEEIGATSIIENVDDGYSGADLGRPALSRLREAVEAKQVDAIVSYDPDRLFRNQAHQSLFIEDMNIAGVEVEFVTVRYEKNPEGKLMFGIRGAVSEYERDKIRERTMRGKRGKANSGKIVMNTRPTGYGWDAENSMYVPNEDAELVRRMFLMAMAGVSVSGIVKTLNSEGIPSPKGSVWQPATIARILHNPLYCGEARQFRQQRRKVNGKHVTTIRDESDWHVVPCPPIVTREEFEQVQNRVAEQKRFSPRNTQRTYMLQHLVKCGVCGKPMYIALHGHKKYYYVCSSQRRKEETGEEGCSNRGVPVDALEDGVWDLISGLALKPAAIRKKLVERQLRSKSSSQQERLRKLEAELLSRQKKTMEFFTKGRIDEAQADESLKEIQKQLQGTRHELSELNKNTGGLSIDQRVLNFTEADRNADNRREACLRALAEVVVTRTDKSKGRYARLEMNVDIVPR